MLTEPSNTTLKRFTSLAAVLDMLVERRLTLLSPATWDDRNDTAYVEAYRQARGVEKIFAMCFTQAPETFHHWRVFSGGLEGMRVNIDKQALLRSLRNDPCYVWNDVEYRTLERMAAARTIDVFDIPFLKRYAFRDELEFRLLYECSDLNAPVHYVPIKRSWIKTITVSPWMPQSLFESVKTAIRSIDGCDRLKVQRTSLRENDRWKGAIKRIVGEGAAATALSRNPINLDIGLDALQAGVEGGGNI
ncbi:hypothetical protein [Sphingobium chungangianum]